MIVNAENGVLKENLIELSKLVENITEGMTISRC